MVKNVHKFEELKPRFKSKPSGLTPITAILSKVLKNNMPSHLNDKKLLTIIVTDGEPTNTEGKLFLLKKGHTTYFDHESLKILIIPLMDCTSFVNCVFHSMLLPLRLKLKSFNHPAYILSNSIKIM